MIELIRPRLVLQTLKPLVTTSPNRSCYRLIGGTLVKRSVTDVVPALETNYSGIKDVLEGLVRSYKSKETEFGAFQREYGISVSRYTFDALSACPPVVSRLTSRCRDSNGRGHEGRDSLFTSLKDTGR